MTWAVGIVLGAILLVGVVVAGWHTAAVLTGNMEEHESNSAPELLRDPSIVIRKRERRLELFDGDKLIKTYKIALGFAPEGDKEKEGDGKTPEGSFYIFGKNPRSKFHLSLGLSYPSTDDAERGLASGIISRAERDAIVNAIRDRRTPPQKTALGGEIFIHGSGVDGDWTRGCIALKNEDIEEIYELVETGAVVTIKP